MRSYQVIFALLWVGFHLHVGVSMTTERAKVELALQNTDGDEDEPIPFQFSEDEINELLYWHNFARSTVTPTASNMEHMSWDPYLQHIAQRWAEECKWVHGQPSDVTTSYGQNLFAGPVSSSVTPKRIVKRWINEKMFYNYTTNKCSKGEVCGHYTQVVWSTTTSLGCGRAQCPYLEGAGKNMYMVVCQYSPAGNVVGFSPYAGGPSCSNCRSGIGQCYENLCRSCEEHDEVCECRQICHNCGTVDMETCRCNCRQGYRGTDCSETCADLHPYCGRSPGFPKYSCRFHRMIPLLCPLTCGSCALPDDDNISCQETTTITVTTTELKTTEMTEETAQETENLVRQDEIVESNLLENNEALEHNEPVVA